MAGKKGMKWYSMVTKREAIRLHEEEGKSHEEIGKLLDIKHRQRVGKWVREYRKAGEVVLEPGQGQRSEVVHRNGKVWKPILLGWKWRTIC